MCIVYPSVCVCALCIGHLTLAFKFRQQLSGYFYLSLSFSLSVSLCSELIAAAALIYCQLAARTRASGHTATTYDHQAH